LLFSNLQRGRSQRPALIFFEIKLTTFAVDTAFDFHEAKVIASMKRLALAAVSSRGFPQCLLLSDR